MNMNLWKVSTLGLAGALTFVVATSGNQAIAEAQPHMREAVETLKIARAQLDKADADKGGHRAKAIQLTDQAIAEVQKGIDFDDTHKGDHHDVTGDGAIPEASTTSPQ